LQKVTENLVTVIEELLDSGQIDRDKIIINVLTQSAHSHIEKYIRKPPNNIFRFHDYKSHHEAIHFLSEHHASLLLINDDAKSVISSRIFELIRGKRPIIGFIPEDGEAAGIIKSTCAGEYCSPNDFDKMKSLLLKYYEQWKQGKIEFNPDENEIRKYDRKLLTSKFAEVLDYTTK
jgi:hypothetical protein